MTEAILAFSPTSLIANKYRYEEKLTLHWVLQFGAATAFSIGFLSIYFNKVNNGYEHFVSTHASIGLKALLLIAGASSGGIAARYSRSFRNVIRPAYLKLVHSTFGVIAYGLAVYAFCLGLQTAWFQSQSSVLWSTILVLLTAVLAFLSALSPIKSIISKIRNLTRTD